MTFHFLFPIFYLLSIQRAISLVPSVTEIIYAIGAQDKLVGVVTPCDYPPGIDKPIVGNFSSVSLERIIALKPDIVFVAGIEQHRLWEKLRCAGLNIVIIAPNNLNAVYESIKEIGIILDKESKADSLVSYMKDEIEKLQKGLPKKLRRVYVEISEKPLVSCGRNSFINEMISLAGGKNIMDDIDQPYPIVNAEEIIRRNPEVIIIAHEGGIDPRKRLGWQSIAAVKNEQIYKDIDPNILMRPGPRIVDGIKALIKCIYPEFTEKEEKAIDKRKK
ncbi:MAG TPA: cobalamin-binding protein [bacterium (Candidatus Stahlbacteria)]|nr:cobalamin-binding protein [Candidatus Stahlbacteria bacterium]